MFLKMVKSAIVCLCPCFFCVFCVFGRVSSQNDFFAHKIGFQICVKVTGFSYVFENG
jgi:hypothetical protein